MVSSMTIENHDGKTVSDIQESIPFNTWDRIAFFLFCAGLLFMIFGSVQAVQAWSGMVGKMSILLACGVPALLALWVRLPEWLKTRKIPVVIFFAAVVLQIGFMVTGLSRDPLSSFKGMILFLVSGVGVLVSGYLLVRTQERLQVVMHLFTLSFVILCGYGFFEYYQSGLDTAHFKVNPVELFSNNPLPAGALLILLSMGPLWGLARTRGMAGKFFYGLILISGIAVIFLIGRKGPLIALAVMVLVFGWARLRRFPVYLALGVLLVLLSIPLWDAVVSDRYLDRFKNAHSSQIRLENYIFGLKVLSNNFWSGVGFNGNYNEFIPDYQARVYIDPRVPGYPRYKEFVWQHHTLENTWFSMLIETGMLFFMAYLLLLAASMKKAFQAGWKSIVVNKERLVMVLPVIGFFLEACTFDSLKFPNLNSVFHVSLVGFVGAISLSGSSSLPEKGMPESEGNFPGPQESPPALKKTGGTGNGSWLWLVLSAAGALLAWLVSSATPPVYFAEATLVIRPNLEYGPYNLELYKTIADRESTMKEIIRRLDLKSPEGKGYKDSRQFEEEFHPTSFYEITNKNNGAGRLVLQIKGPDRFLAKEVCKVWSGVLVEEGKRISKEVSEREIQKRVAEVARSKETLFKTRQKYDYFQSRYSMELLENEVTSLKKMLTQSRLKKVRLENRLKKNLLLIEELKTRLNQKSLGAEIENYFKHKLVRAELRISILPKQILNLSEKIENLGKKLSKLETEMLDRKTVSFELVQNLNTWNQIYNKDEINLKLIQRVFEDKPNEVKIVSPPELPRNPVNSGLVSRVMSGAFTGLILGLLITFFRNNFSGGERELSQGQA